MRLLLMVAVALMVAGCGSVKEQCWGDQNGVNYCMSFAHEHPWTGGVAVTSSLYPKHEATMLSTSTGIVSSMGGSGMGEVAQHFVVAP